MVLLAKFRLFFDHRLWLLLVPALLVMFWLDAPVAKSLLFSLCGMSIILGFAHLARRILLSSLDLSADIDAAEGGSMPNAIIVLAVILLYVAIMIGAILWLHG